MSFASDVMTRYLGESMKKEHVEITCPSRSEDAKLFNAIIKQGIDAHLEGFTQSNFEHRDGRLVLNFHVSEIKILLRRLEEEGSEQAMTWYYDIKELDLKNL